AHHPLEVPLKSVCSRLGPRPLKAPRRALTLDRPDKLLLKASVVAADAMHGQRIHELIREDDAADSVEVFFGYPMDGTFEPGQLFFLTGAHGGTRLDYRVLQALEGFGRFGCECLENV